MQLPLILAPIVGVTVDRQPIRCTNTAQLFVRDHTRQAEILLVGSSARSNPRSPAHKRPYGAPVSYLPGCPSSSAPPQSRPSVARHAGRNRPMLTPRHASGHIARRLYGSGFPHRAPAGSRPLSQPLRNRTVGRRGRCQDVAIGPHCMVRILRGKLRSAPHQHRPCLPPEGSRGAGQPGR